MHASMACVRVSGGASGVVAARKPSISRGRVSLKSPSMGARGQRLSLVGFVMRRHLSFCPPNRPADVAQPIRRPDGMEDARRGFVGQ